MIDVNDWQELDRAIVGDFLGYISMRSYLRGRFFASAIVVSKDTGLPGEGFYSLLRDLEVIPNLQRTDALEEIWLDHVNRAHTWFARH